MFPSVQSLRLSPKTGRTPSLRPLDGTDAQLQSVLTFGWDGRPVAVHSDIWTGQTAGPYRCLSLCFIFEFHEHYVSIIAK